MNVVLELVLCVALVRNAPVEQPHVEARFEQALNEAVAGGEVEDVAAADQAEHNEQRRCEPDIVVAVVPQFGSAAAPHDVLWCAADAGAGAGGQADPVTRAADIALDVAAHALEHAMGVGYRYHPTPFLQDARRCAPAPVPSGARAVGPRGPGDGRPGAGRRQCLSAGSPGATPVRRVRPPASGQWLAPGSPGRCHGRSAWCALGSPGAARRRAQRCRRACATVAAGAISRPPAGRLCSP